MNYRDAFILQARADWSLYIQLTRLSDIPESQQLLMLQMATEKLAKAIQGSPLGGTVENRSHAALTKAMRVIGGHRATAELLGMSLEALGRQVKTVAPLCARIEGLCPALAGEGPNIEYPWKTPGSQDYNVPSMHAFGVLDEIRTQRGANLLKLLKTLLDNYDRLF